MATSPIIDTPFNAASKAVALRRFGIETVIRYYNFRNSSVFPDKCLTIQEAQAVCASGLKLATIFQQRQNQIGDFSHEIGVRAGHRTYELAADTVGQPEGSAIYFAVDFDASESEIDEHILPYFEGVRGSMLAHGDGTARYRIGAYGSGLVCRKLRESGLAELTWLSMSRGFRGTRAALEAGGWHLNQLPAATTVLGLGVDFDESNPSQPDFGGFSVEEEEAHSNLADLAVGSTAARSTMRVTARSGLRLRSGPGTDFDVIGLMPMGAAVHVRGIYDGWAKIDRYGDGNIDGFGFAAFLE